MRRVNGINTFGILILTIAVGSQVLAGETFYMPEYWPLESGRIVQYQHTNANGEISLTNESTAGPLDWGAAREVWRVQNVLDGWRHSFYWKWKDGFLCSYGFDTSGGAWSRNGDPCEVLPEMLPASARRLRVGNGARFDSDAGAGFNRPFLVTCHGLEMVLTPAGSFEALHIELFQTWPGENGGVEVYPSDVYLARGVGVVLRRDARQGVRTELVSYSSGATSSNSTYSAPGTTIGTSAPNPDPLANLASLPSLAELPTPELLDLNGPNLETELTAFPDFPDTPAATPPAAEEEHGAIYNFFHAHPDWPMWKRVAYWATWGH